MRSGVPSDREAITADHRLTQQLTSQAGPVELGGKSWTDVLSNRLRIGRGEARRPTPRQWTITGERLPPPGELPTARRRRRADCGL